MRNLYLLALSASIFTAATSGVAQAGDAQRFASMSVDVETISDVPADITAFAETIYRLSEEGALQTGTGTEPQDALGGMSPKQYLLAHVAADFRCERDFGGFCGATGKLRSIYNFISLAAQGAVPDWVRDETYGSVADMPLIDLDLTLGEALLPLPVADRFTGWDPEGDGAPSLPLVLGQLTVSRNGSNEVCFPGIPTTGDTYELASSYFGEDYGLSGMAYFLAAGKRNTDVLDLHLRPAGDSAVVNRIKPEVFLAPGPTLVPGPSGERRWLLVIPSHGEIGFLDTAGTRLHVLSPVVQDQTCFRTESGKLMISAYIGAGD